MNALPEVKHCSITQCAQIMRNELKRTFPRVKFSVRSQRYSMGCHVNVSWTDGPNGEAVDKAIGWISGKTFDGTDDSTHYHDTEWNGQMVHFAGSAPSTSRRITNVNEKTVLAAELLRSLCVCTTSQCGQTVAGPEVPNSHAWFGSRTIDELGYKVVWSQDLFRGERLVDAINRVVFGD